MKFPRSLNGSTCDDLVDYPWQLSYELAGRLLRFASIFELRFPNLGGLSIISGFRTAEEQEDLERAGAPAAPDELSTHRTCPSTGADFMVPIAADAALLSELGSMIQAAGLRWGGGSPRNDYGIPTDWGHVDLGPRTS